MQIQPTPKSGAADLPRWADRVRKEVRREEQRDIGEAQVNCACWSGLRPKL